ncbi:MAG TPA: ribosomal protein S18-alanine N-acetyltransferase [Pyrinomonadaceae bacterium]|jgi:ribosomal-protein-alanine N-acetyltransferase
MSRVGRAKGQGLDYEIVTMSAHDLLEVVEIEETSGLSRWGWDSYHAELGRPEAIMLVARRLVPDAEGKKLHGFFASRLGADELHINNIGVRERERKKGIGGELLRRGLELGARRGALAALLEVRAGNDVAQLLYASQGFEVVGRRRNYYHDPAEDALVMTKQLRRAGT